VAGGERHFVRFATLAVVVGAAVGAALMHVPGKLPSTAMGSVALLFFERFVVVFVALLFLLVALFRGWRGELPIAISEKGAEWQPIEEQTTSLQEQIDELQRQLEDVETELDARR
jgi:peptidoglycan hydrolase CwlO-like protein